jgi:CheY-like chemotaxis protein
VKTETIYRNKIEIAGQPRPPRLAFHHEKPAKVLIVDDDVDAALLVEQVFSRLGCATTTSLTGREAQAQICSTSPDVIILDWCLDRNTEASRILSDCARIFSRFGSRRAPPKVVTYSSLKAHEIEVIQNPYFKYWGHWEKPIAPAEMLERVLALLDKIEH